MMRYDSEGGIYANHSYFPRNTLSKPPTEPWKTPEVMARVDKVNKNFEAASTALMSHTKSVNDVFECLKDQIRELHKHHCEKDGVIAQLHTVIANQQSTIEEQGVKLADQQTVIESLEAELHTVSTGLDHAVKGFETSMKQLSRVAKASARYADARIAKNTLDYETRMETLQDSVAVAKKAVVEMVRVENQKRQTMNSTIAGYEERIAQLTVDYEASIKELKAKRPPVRIQKLPPLGDVEQIASLKKEIENLRAVSEQELETKNTTIKSLRAASEQELESKNTMIADLINRLRIKNANCKAAEKKIERMADENNVLTQHVELARQLLAGGDKKISDLEATIRQLRCSI